MLGQLALLDLTTEKLREAQAEIARRSAATLRPRHIILESVELRGVVGLAFTAQVNQTAEMEQRALTDLDQLRIASPRAEELRDEAAGIAASHSPCQLQLPKRTDKRSFSSRASPCGSGAGATPIPGVPRRPRSGPRAPRWRPSPRS